MATMIFTSFNTSTDRSYTETSEQIRPVSFTGTIVCNARLVISSILTLTFFYQFVIRYLILHHRPPKGLKLIPGPISTIPFLGRLHGINTSHPWLTMHAFSNQYNKLFRLTAYGEMHIWIGDAKIAKDLIVNRAAKYSSRPEIAAMPGADKGGRYMALSQFDDHWRIQRRFAHTVIMASHTNSYYGLLEPEAIRLLYSLIINPRDHYAQTEVFTSRVSTRLCYGSAKTAARHCRNSSELTLQLSPTNAGPATHIFPFLMYFPEWLVPSKRAIREQQDREHELWTGDLARVKSELANGTAAAHSYARTYLERMQAAKSSSTDIKDFGFDEAEAANALGIICTMAVFTVAGMIHNFWLMMTVHPAWQARVREEIDRVVGSDRIVDMADSPNLPVLRAVIRECLRWKPPAPLGVPHLVTEDDEYNGYHIPKGSVVHVIEQALTRDPELYPDGDSFRPERWLEKEWPTYQEPLTVYPRLKGASGFGWGKRACDGTEQAQAELVVACGSLIWGFEMHPDIDPKTGEQVWPDPFNRSSNVFGGPNPFEFDLRVREGRAERIRNMFEQIKSQL